MRPAPGGHPGSQLKVAALFPQGTQSAGDVLTNARQAEAAQRALTAVERAWKALEAGVTPDALLTDVEEALSALGELTGKTVREDVTARIFGKIAEMEKGPSRGSQARPS